MTQDAKSLQAVVMRRFQRLNAVFQGVVVGLLFGLVMFVATNWLVLKGGAVVGPHLALLGQFFIGYRVTFAGSIIGFGYGFLAGFVVGFGIAWLYNQMLTLRGHDGGART